MAIAPGTRFDRYEVAEQIGIGGMGVVYRATDTNLKRDVAVKILPDSFAKDPDRVARFQREAEVLASLNHANIAQIYGLEKAGGNTVIVMELVEGPTLADRIAEGPVPAGEALAIARQIADALEAAHGRHIIHRDLKPQNIKLRPDGTIKVLDFGIAKALDANAISGGRSALTTPAVTETGVILGSAAYMSPEQARGKTVDQRTDIWAFGCVLFEMLTGRPAFGGEDVMLTLARVLDRDTDMSSMPGTISPAVRQTIKLCLEKDPKKRVADIRDVRLALEGAFETALPGAAAPTATAPPAARRRLPIAAALLVGAAVVWFLKPEPPPTPENITRFTSPLPTGVDLRAPVSSVLDIAPNGEFFAFNGTDGIYVRAMGDTEARVIPGTGGDVVDVAISPDGREIAYFRAAVGTPELVKVAADGGAPVVLVDSITDPLGLSWGADGTLLYGQADGIWRVSDTGGTPERIIATEGDERVYGPQLLPGGEWVLFTLSRTTGVNRWNEADIVVESLAGGDRRVLRSGGTDARYLPSGHITYVFGNVLFASAFDATSLELDAERVSLVQGVQTSLPVLGGAAFYAVSNNGTLIYVPGLAGEIVARQLKGLAWVDRRGNAEPVPVRLDDYSMARLSPDGTKVALVIGTTLPRSEPAPDIYIFDLETQNLTQLTFGPEPDDGPVWSRDGSRIFFRSYPDGPSGAVFSIPADGGTAELLARSPTGLNPLPWSVSADDRTLVLVDANSLNDVNLATLDVDNGKELTPLIDETRSITEPSLSPNGQWLVYHDFGEQNQRVTEVNLRPYPAVRQQRRPVGPGMHPVFSADGSEIFFFDGGGLSAAAVQYTPFRVGVPQMLFRGEYWYGVASAEGLLGRAWDVDSKNDRFLLITMPDNGRGAEADTRTRIEVVLNWSTELKTRVPKP